MKIRVVEIEADARELRESSTLAQNFERLLARCFQNTESFDDDTKEEDEQDE